MSHNPFVQHAEMQLLRGAHAEALRAARMGLALFSDDVELLEIAASCAAEVGDFEVAADCWERLIRLVPTAQACNSLGLALEKLQRLDAAEAAYRQALVLAPEDATPHTNLGLVLENLRLFDEAESLQRRAWELSPDSAEICSNLAGLLGKLGNDSEAEALYREAIQLKPDFAIAHSNLGVLLVDCRREAEAESCFREALRLQPEHLHFSTNLAELLLVQGYFAEGWALYETRQQVFTEAGTGPTVNLPPCPQWQGESLVGKSIVVLPEQGLGDEIQFCRYLGWLKAQGAARVTLVCRPSQKKLLQTLAGPDLVVDLQEAVPHIPGHDYWVFLLSLPRHAGTTLASIPANIPYLSPDPQTVARLSPLLAGDGLRVGVVWRGNPKHLNDAERSLPDLSVLAPLWSVEGVRFFSLQKGEGVLPDDLPITDLGGAITDFADTAALLAQLDLLITVDTSVAHLGGALGVPCWVLLPRHRMDWRWLQGRNDSPWYPTLRLFRQEKRGDWAAVVDQVLSALRGFAK